MTDPTANGDTLWQTHQAMKYLITLVSLLLMPLIANAQWSTFHFTDDWGDKTENLGARSAPTRAVNGLPFPYQDRRLRLMVEDCNTAWIRFNDNMVFGRGHIRIRVDGREIDVSGSSDHRTDITIFNSKALIPLLAKANRLEILVPLHDMSPQRFSVNMSGSMRAMENVCSQEAIAGIAEAQARRDSVRAALVERERRRRTLEAEAQARRDSVKAVLDAHKSNLCQKPVMRRARTNASRNQYSNLKTRANLRYSFSENRLSVNKEKWEQLTHEEQAELVRGAVVFYGCVNNLLLDGEAKEAILVYADHNKEEVIATFDWNEAVLSH